MNILNKASVLAVAALALGVVSVGESSAALNSRINLESEGIARSSSDNRGLIDEFDRLGQVELDDEYDRLGKAVSQDWNEGDKLDRLGRSVIDRRNGAVGDELDRLGKAVSQEWNEGDELDRLGRSVIDRRNGEVGDALERLGKAIADDSDEFDRLGRAIDHDIADEDIDRLG